MTRDVAIIIPVYNEEKVIVGVINELREHYKTIVCVDDGSSDKTADLLKKCDVFLIRHSINMGQGAALQTGIEFARATCDVKYFATFDADGQHSVADLASMIKKLDTGDYDIVLGSRFLGSSSGISSHRAFILKLAVWFTNTTTGLHLTDTHNGLRAFKKKVADDMQITMPDMNHASEILEMVAEKQYKYVEVPVHIKYTDYSKSKGQSLINAVNIGFDTLLRIITK